MPLSSLRHHSYSATVIKIIVAIMTILLIGILCIILFSESLLRWVVEDKGSDFLGREVSINGAANVEWYWGHTHIYMGELHLENAEQFKDPYMMKVEQIELDFRPLQLLRGRVDIRDINIVAPEVFLERKSKELANWYFPTLFGVDPVDAVAPESRYEIPVIDQLKIIKGHIVFNDAVKKINMDMQLDSITAMNDKAMDKNETNELKGVRVDKGYALRGKGTLQGKKFNLEATGGSLQSLRDKSEPYPLRFKLDMGETKVSVDGKFQDLIKLEGIDAILKIEGASLADIFYLTAIPLPPTPH